jgi:hypothetical protein
VNSGLTPFISLCFLPSFTQASKPTTHTTTVAALHVPEPMAPTHPKNEPTMDPSSSSPLLSPTATVANAFKEGASPGSIDKQHCPKNGTNENGAVDEDAVALVQVAAENSGGDSPRKMIKMATKEEKVLGIVLSKDDDDTRRLKISTTENDATTKVANDATAEGYENIGEGALL